MKTLVIDANGLAHKVRYKNKGLSFDGNETGVLYGFITQILKLSKKFHTNKFVFCWDSPNGSHRKQIFKDYKRKRREKNNDKSSEEIVQDMKDFQQIDMLRENVLFDLGFKNSYCFDGFEGDDLIASVVINNEGDFVMVSQDHDMYQLLDRSDMYWDDSKKNVEFTKELFEKVYGIHPTRWADVLALAGCKTDEVPGVEGVGEKTAIKYINGDLKPNSAILKKIISKKDAVMPRNERLVKLPFLGCPKIKIKRNEVFNVDDIIGTVEQYGMYSLSGKKFNDWKYFIQEI